MDRQFIESVQFPSREVSDASGGEKRGGGMPPYWRMVFWWTRKPLISARAVIAGSLLPEDTNASNFLKSIGIGQKIKSAHRYSPRFSFDGVRLLDPFAGFGSIPLEGLRLGLDVTAVELLPVAYIFLKAVLEYPAKYGRRLARDVDRWGDWITKRLGEDPVIRELYERDVVAYIGSWEVKCPTCRKWTPLIGNWWLSKVRDSKGYKKLAWMEPAIEGEEVRIRVMDLSKTIGDESARRAKVSRLTVVAGGKDFKVPESNIEARREQGTCLHCANTILWVDPGTGKHYADKKGLPVEARDRIEGYIRTAISISNRLMYQSKDSIKLGGIEEAPARIRLLVKVRDTRKGFEFEPCLEEDQEKLELAKREVLKMLELNDPDIPKEPVPTYEVRRITPFLGVTRWFQFFNPRQLVTLVKLARLIREAGMMIENECVEKQNLNEDAREYAGAVTTYLAIALARYVDYNSICTVWNCGGQLPAQVAHTISMRGIAMMWNWGDVSPFADMSGTGSWFKNLKSAIKQSLKYLTDISVQGQNVEVVLDDSTILNALGNYEFDLITTDPPYYDDVPYSELSDFYYVWLKRALSDVSHDNRLAPRFMSNAFFERIGQELVEVSTQWEKHALSEVSLNPPRLGPSAGKENGVTHFQNLLNSSFCTMASRLIDDGLLVTYYAHTDPDAWKALLKAGWVAAGFRVTNAFPLATESAQSIVSRGKLSMDTSILVPWRKGSEGSIDASSLYGEMVEEATNRARMLMDQEAVGRDLVIGTLAAALAIATSYREVRVMGKVNVSTLVDEYVYPATYLGMAKALAKKAEIKDGVKSPVAMFYLLVKSILAGARTKVLESTDARIFSIGTSLDINQAMRRKILRRGKKGRGAQVAKAKTLTLIEPTSTDKSKLAELLEVREIGTRKPEIGCSVDALHALEYFAVADSRDAFGKRLEELRAEYPAYMEEALSMVRILAKALPEKDVEFALCNRILDHLAPKLE